MLKRPRVAKRSNALLGIAGMKIGERKIVPHPVNFYPAEKRAAVLEQGTQRCYRFIESLGTIVPDERVAGIALTGPGTATLRLSIHAIEACAHAAELPTSLIRQWFDRDLPPVGRGVHANAANHVPIAWILFNGFSRRANEPARQTAHVAVSPDRINGEVLSPVSLINFQAAPVAGQHILAGANCAGRKGADKPKREQRAREKPEDGTHKTAPKREQWPARDAPSGARRPVFIAWNEGRSCCLPYPQPTQ